MKVVQIVADGRPGGGTAVVLDLLAATRAAGAQAHLLTEPGSYAARAAREAGALVHEVPFFGSGVVPTRHRIRKLLDDIAPRVVHIHGSRAAFYAGPSSTHFPAISFHYTVHGYHFEHRAPARRVLGRLAERRATRSLRSWVHVCNYDADLGDRHRLRPEGAQWRVIANGVDVGGLDSLRSEHQSGVAFVARMIPQKDPELAAEILCALAERGIPSRVVGDGTLGDRFREKVRTHPEIECLGSRSRVEALKALASATLLILPSRWEGLPVVILEAMALGVAVAASPVGGIPEILDAEGIGTSPTGLLIPSRDPEVWASQIAALLSDPQRLHSLTTKARQLVAQRFDWKRCRDEHLALYGLG